MASSLEPSSIYWEAMSLFREALARAAGGRKLQAEAHAKHDKKLSQTAQLFTAALTIAELADTADDPETAEFFTVAFKGVMMPFAYLLWQIGPYGRMPQDLKDAVAALLKSYETQAPAQAQQLAAIARNN